MKTPKPFRKPDQQGRLDGMCAIYATLNCVKLLFNHTEKQDESLFKHLCKQNAALFPKIMYEGVGVPGLRKVLASANEWVEKNHKGSRLEIHSGSNAVSFPFIDSYFTWLQNRFLDRMRLTPNGESDGAWVIGLNTPWDHWTCVRGFTDKLVLFYDSYGMRRYRRESFTLNKSEAGDERGKKILIDQHQSFWIQRVTVPVKRRRKTPAT